MYCLLADTYKRKTSDKPDELAKFQREAIEAYKKAVWSDSHDDVIQYALDSATTMLSGNKDWAGIAALHGEFLQKKPDSPLALLSATWVAKMKTREGKGVEAAEMLANSLRARIANPVLRTGRVPHRRAGQNHRAAQKGVRSRSRRPRQAAHRNSQQSDRQGRKTRRPTPGFTTPAPGSPRCSSAPTAPISISRASPPSTPTIRRSSVRPCSPFPATSC